MIRQSEKVTQALALVAGGMTPYAAARQMGIALSTIYRAQRRQLGKYMGLIYMTPYRSSDSLHIAPLGT
jgi:transposase